MYPRGRCCLSALGLRKGKRRPETRMNAGFQAKAHQSARKVRLPVTRVLLTDRHAQRSGRSPSLAHEGGCRLQRTCATNKNERIMKLTQIKLSNFQSFGPDATLIGMAAMTFLLGPQRDREDGLPAGIDSALRP